MYKSAQRAGMIQDVTGDNGGSKHHMAIVLEPEAASMYCFNRVANPKAEAQVKGQEPYLVVGV